MQITEECIEKNQRLYNQHIDINSGRLVKSIPVYTLWFSSNYLLLKNKACVLLQRSSPGKPFMCCCENENL